MPSSPEAALFETLRDRLLAAGIAPRHVSRYLGELRDHLNDLSEASGDRYAALVRLGTLEELTEAALARPELRSWVARAPWAAFLVAPPILMVGLFVLAGLLLVLLLLPYRGNSASVPEELRATILFLTRSIVYVAPILLGWLMALVGIRQRTGPWWVLAGMALIAILAGGSEVDVFVARSAHELNELMVTTALLPPFPRPSQHAVQTLVILALTVGPYLLWRRRERMAA